MRIIPLAATPSQTLNVLLDGQYCKLNVYQKSTGLYLDLSNGGVSILTGVICRDRVTLVSGDHLGFAGNLVFADTQGTSDPEYTGIGSRYILAYMGVDE